MRTVQKQGFTGTENMYKSGPAKIYLNFSRDKNINILYYKIAFRLKTMRPSLTQSSGGHGDVYVDIHTKKSTDGR